MSEHKDQEDKSKSIFSDENSFEQAFKEYYTALYLHVRPIVKSADVAEDIVQELFTKLWNKRDSIFITGSLKAYLYRAAVNAALDHIEKYKKVVSIENHAGLENSLGTNSVDEKISGSELSELIEKAINLLPPACKTVFLLSREKEMSYKEIAETLEISVKTVENQMGKALKVLREELKPHIGDLMKLLTIILSLIKF